MMAASRIEGVSILAKSFKTLKQDMQRDTSRRMVAKGAAVVKSAAKAEIQATGLVLSGDMLRNVVIKREKRTPAGTVQYNIGVRHGAALGNGKKVVKYLALSKTGRVVTKRKNDPFYWRFLEFGTKYIRALHPIEKGFEKSQSAILPAMEAQLLSDISKAGK